MAKRIWLWKRECCAPNGRRLQARCIEIGSAPPAPGDVFEITGARTVKASRKALIAYELLLPKLTSPEVRAALLEPYPVIGQVRKVDPSEWS